MSAARSSAFALLFFAALFLLTNAGFDTSEGIYDYRVAERIVAHGELGFPDAPPEHVYTRGPNGRWYTAHEAGNTLLLLPAALCNCLLARTLLAGRDPHFVKRVSEFVVSLQAVFYSALTATAFFAILSLGFGLTRQQAFFSTLALALTSYFWTYSRNLFDGVLCSTLLTGSFLALLRWRESRRDATLLAAFALLGFAVITRLTMTLAVLASLLYVAQLAWPDRRGTARALALAAAALAPFAGWQLWFNHLRSGLWLVAPIMTPEYEPRRDVAGFLEATASLLVGPGKSLFVFAPLLLIAALRLPRFFRAHRREAIYVAVLGVLWLLVHASVGLWGSGWGPRYFVTVLPILFLPGAVALPALWASRRWRAAISVLGGFGFWLALSSVISNWHFRMGLAAVEGRAAGFDWNLRDNQTTDMLRAGVGNLLRWLHAKPLLTLPGASEANVYASSTLNVWENSFVHAGVPWWMVAPVALALVAGMAVSARRLLRSAP